MSDEITAEIEVQAVAPKAELRVRPSLSFGAKTDLGRVRENNEDKLEFHMAETDDDLASRGHVFVVCDGMGGHEAGQIASELACKTFLDVYKTHPAESAADASEAATKAANRFVADVARAVPSRKDMGTTITTLAIVQDRAVISQVGDSRCYRLRDGELAMLTTDHTWVEEMVASGQMEREQAEQHPYRHMLLRAIGTEPEVNPDVFDHEVREGDVYLLCSDGVTNHVSDPEIQRILAEHGPSSATWRLVNAALAGGGSDNATAIVVRVDELRTVGR